MAKVTVKFSKISIEKMLEYKQQILDINDIKINIPNVTSHRLTKNIGIDAIDPIIISIRELFNKVTEGNVKEIRQQLHDIISTRVRSVEMLQNISKELLTHMISNSLLTQCYVQMLNIVYRLALKIDGENKFSYNVGHFFLDNCQETIFQMISKENVARLAELDPYDEDDMDKYNKETEKITNLITLICLIYEQRDKKNVIRLKATQIASVMNNIFHNDKEILKSMEELGDPYQGKGTCKDEEKYLTYERMHNINGLFLYTFCTTIGNSIKTDETFIHLQDGQTITLSYFIPMIKQFPKTIKDAYLLELYKKIEI